MSCRSIAAAALACAALLAGCGDLPQPFAGNPGRNARRLSQPPPARLVVEPASAALLPDAAVNPFALAVADALVAREVPAVAGYGRRGDWRLLITAELEAGRVVPSFAVQDPAGKPRGATRGAPVDPAQWQVAGEDLLRGEATAAAPDISLLLDRIEAAREESDPNSLINRPAKLALKGVNGAPGDGDLSLARQLRDDLAKRGEVMQDATADADFVIEGQVHAAVAGRGLIRIELQWIVTDAQGRESGRVVQINEVPEQAVSGLWGDVAIAAAQEAANGVRDVIARRLEGRAQAAPRPAS